MESKNIIKKYKTSDNYFKKISIIECQANKKELH